MAKIKKDKTKLKELEKNIISKIPDMQTLLFVKDFIVSTTLMLLEQFRVRFNIPEIKIPKNLKEKLNFNIPRSQRPIFAAILIIIILIILGITGYIVYVVAIKEKPKMKSLKCNIYSFSQYNKLSKIIDSGFKRLNMQPDREWIEQKEYDLQVINIYNWGLKFYETAFNINFTWCERPNTNLYSFNKYKASLLYFDTSLRINPISVYLQSNPVAEPTEISTPKSHLKNITGKDDIKTTDDVKTTDSGISTSINIIRPTEKPEIDEPVNLPPAKSLTAEQWYEKGSVLYDQGKYKGSIQCYEKALELNPKDTIALNSKGLVLYEKGRLEEAITCFDEVLKLEPEHITARSCRDAAKKTLGGKK